MGLSPLVVVRRHRRRWRPTGPCVAMKRDAHGHGGGDRADEDVAVADVADLVGQHAAQLVPVEDLEDALGDGDRGVVGVAAGGEGVGLHVGA